VRVGNLIDMKSITDELDSILQTVPESRVAGPVQELVVIHEESLRATHTVVAPYVIRPPELACKCSLHSVTLRQVELMRRKSLLQLL